MWQALRAVSRIEQNPLLLNGEQCETEQIRSRSFQQEAMTGAREQRCGRTERGVRRLSTQGVLLLSIPISVLHASVLGWM
jgi:hypothetical protein